jgi:hypothetical protein
MNNSRIEETAEHGAEGRPLDHIYAQLKAEDIAVIFRAFF